MQLPFATNVNLHPRWDLSSVFSIDSHAAIKHFMFIMLVLVSARLIPHLEVSRVVIPDMKDSQHRVSNIPPNSYVAFEHFGASV